MFAKTTNLIKAALLVTALMLFSRPALADSWPTSFDFTKDSVKLKVKLAGDARAKTHELQPYRGTGYSPADSLAITKAVIREIGKGGVTEGRVYNLVQLIDSVGFNMPYNAAGKKATKAVYKAFEQGLVKLAKARDGHGELALAVNTVYRQLRDAQNVRATEQAWHPTEKQEKALGRRLKMGSKYNPRKVLEKMQDVGRPAMDLIVAALRNDVAYQLGYQVADKDIKKAKKMFIKSEQNYARAIDRALLAEKGVAKTTVRGIRKFGDYATYFKSDAPLLSEAFSIFQDKTLNPDQKRLKVQTAFAKRWAQLGKGLRKLPSFVGDRKVKLYKLVGRTSPRQSRQSRR